MTAAQDHHDKAADLLKRLGNADNAGNTRAMSAYALSAQAHAMMAANLHRWPHLDRSYDPPRGEPDKPAPLKLDEVEHDYVEKCR